MRSLVCRSLYTLTAILIVVSHSIRRCAVKLFIFTFKLPLRNQCYLLRWVCLLLVLPFFYCYELLLRFFSLYRFCNVSDLYCGQETKQCYLQHTWNAVPVRAGEHALHDFNDIKAALCFVFVSLFKRGTYTKLTFKDLVNLIGYNNNNNLVIFLIVPTKTWPVGLIRREIQKHFICLIFANFL